jgi:ABC-type bacteriocin/lantibiotic exporter with double-glycine peptidase domain
MRLFVLLFLTLLTYTSCWQMQEDKKFPFYKQNTPQECGPTCLRIIFKYHGKEYSQLKLNKMTKVDSIDGTNLLSLNETAENLGYSTRAVALDFTALSQALNSPCIAHWENNHFLVVYKIEGDKVYISDPATGLCTYDTAKFCKGWLKNDADYKNEGIVMFIEKKAALNKEITQTNSE